MRPGRQLRPERQVGEAPAPFGLARPGVALPQPDQREAEPATSSSGQWQAHIETQHTDRTTGHRALRDHVAKTLAYLRRRGISDKEVRVSSAEAAAEFENEVQGKGEDRVDKRLFKGFKTSQSILVSSREVDPVERVSREVTQLMEGGVPSSPRRRPASTRGSARSRSRCPPRRRGTRTRAERMLEAAGGASLGRLRRADMGVININPANSTEVSAEGDNDTSSLVRCSFELRD